MRLPLRLATCATLAILISPVAHAGPLLERWREQRAARAAEVAATHEATLPAGAQRISNIGYGNDPAQRFDVYLPTHADHAPVIFMVHGGGWAYGDKNMSRVVDAKVARWVERGFIFITINYRMLPAAKPDVQLQDVALALATAQNKAAGWGGDPRSFILMGHSAGAHLVALFNANPHAVSVPGILPVLGTVSLDSAAMNVVDIMKQRHFGLYDAPFGTDPAYWQRMSPYFALQAGAAPILAVCSTRRSDSCDQAGHFVQRAHELGLRAETLPEDLSHAQINSELGLPSAYTSAVEQFMASLSPRAARLLQ